MRSVITALIFLATANPAIAQDAVTFRVFGIGRASCASWLSNFQSEQEGSAWILGYWTATNYSDAMANRVEAGSTTDGSGMIGEMKKRCMENPAENFHSQLLKLIIEFRARGK